VPNQPKTPLRAFRIPEPLYRTALRKARANDRTLTDVVVEALEKYVEGEKDEA
jgi:hypothetical protein